MLFMCLGNSRNKATKTFLFYGAYILVGKIEKQTKKLCSKLHGNVCCGEKQSSKGNRGCRESGKDMGFQALLTFTWLGI